MRFESEEAAPDTPTKQRTEAILERFHEEATFDKGHDVRLLMALWPFIKSHQLWFWVATLVIIITAVASLFNDYTAYVVSADSPIKTGKDLVARLRKDPKSVTIGFSPLLGSHNHIAAGLLMKAAGGNARDLKVVAYKGSADAIPNLMGGHIDLITTAAGNVAGHVASGRLRVMAISADKRLPGALAEVPTWKEQGVSVLFGAWRGIFAPKGITSEQIAYWESALRKATEAQEWKADLQKNMWADAFVGSAAFQKELDQDYKDMRSVLSDLGLAK
jgi:putative tricarboxylic transport membrane protein